MRCLCVISSIRSEGMPPDDEIYKDDDFWHLPYAQVVSLENLFM